MSNDTSKFGVAAPRIGRGIVAYVSGALLIAAGIFGLLAAAQGGEGAGPFGIACLAAGSAVVMIGFWVRLFAKLELRLIDIQTGIAAAAYDQGHRAQKIAPSTPSAPPVKTDTDAEKALMARLGITPVYDGYRYKTLRYDLLDDAVRYARSQSKVPRPADV